MNTLCESVLNTATTRCPALVHKATFVKNTFQKVLHFFSQCRDIYDSSRILKIGMLGMNEWLI